MKYGFNLRNTKEYQELQAKQEQVELMMICNEQIKSYIELGDLTDDLKYYQLFLLVESSQEVLPQKVYQRFREFIVTYLKPLITHYQIIYKEFGIKVVDSDKNSYLKDANELYKFVMLLAVLQNLYEEQVEPTVQEMVDAYGDTLLITMTKNNQTNMLKGE